MKNLNAYTILENVVRELDALYDREDAKHLMDSDFVTGHLDDLDEVAFFFRKKYSRCLRIATKYQNITREFLIDKQVTNFEIIESQGATEGAIANGIADAIVDISSTGETLKQNRLKTIEDGILLKSFASIFINKRYFKKNKSDLELKRLLDQIVLGS